MSTKNPSNESCETHNGNTDYGSNIALIKENRLRWQRDGTNSDNLGTTAKRKETLHHTSLEIHSTFAS